MATFFVAAAALGFNPAAGVASGWQAPLDLGPTKGNQRLATVAVGAGGDVGVLVVAKHGCCDTTIAFRRVDARGRLGRPLLLERTVRTIDSPALIISRDGTATASWLISMPGPLGGTGTATQRLHAARLPRTIRKRAFGVVELTDGRASQAPAEFVPGIPGPVLQFASPTGVVSAARWAGDSQPALTELSLPFLATQALRGTPSGRLIAAYPAGRAVFVSASAGLGQPFGPAVAVPGVSRPPAGVELDLERSGAGVLSWTEQSRAKGRSQVRLAAFNARGTLGSAVTVGGSPLNAATPLALGGGRALVTWLADGGLDRSPGTLTARRVNTRRKQATAVVLGSGREQAYESALLPASRGAATIIWLTETGALRAQAIRSDSTTARTITLAWGVPRGTTRSAAAGRTTAISYRARGRLLLRIQHAP